MEINKFTDFSFNHSHLLLFTPPPKKKILSIINPKSDKVWLKIQVHKNEQYLSPILKGLLSNQYDFCDSNVASLDKQ